MTTSLISLCNRALDLLGADPLTSLEDQSKAARLCARNFSSVRDAVLRSYPWNCAMQRIRLPALADPPAFGYYYQYRLPEGPNPPYCLRVYEVMDGDEWQLEGRAILTDYAPPLAIRYVARLEDPNLFDSLLAECVSAALGVYLAANLTEAASRVEAMQQRYQQLLAEARRIDAQEEPSQRLDANQWLESRI